MRFFLLTSLALLVLVVRVSAQDRVTIHPREAVSPIILLGNVVDYTGSALTMRLANGAPQIVEAEAVLGVETFYEPEHREGLAAFESGDEQLARTKFEAALQRENRDWVEREIHAALIKLSNRQGDQLGAAQRFLLIAKSDPVTRHWGVAPLIWSPVPLSTPLLQQGRAWLADEHVAARLIGASWLLFHPTYGEPAQNELKRLSSNSNERVSALARAQMWRVLMAGGQVSEEILHSWREDIDRLPKTMRGGPQYLLARALRLRGETRAAAAEFLWLPLVYTDNEPLAARALSLAAEEYEAAGLQRESQTLIQELLVRYDWSPEARVSREKSPAP